MNHIKNSLLYDSYGLRVCVCVFAIACEVEWRVRANRDVWDGMY